MNLPIRPRRLRLYYVGFLTVFCWLLAAGIFTAAMWTAVPR